MNGLNRVNGLQDDVHCTVVSNFVSVCLVLNWIIKVYLLSGCLLNLAGGTLSSSLSLWGHSVVQAQRSLEISKVQSTTYCPNRTVIANS